VFIEAPEESTVDDEVADWYEKQRNAWGYLPNYAPAFATRPDVARAWNTLNNAVRGHMERRRFELATIAAARAYRSTYCMAAHCKFLRDACGDESTMRAVAADPSGANLDATDRAVMDFATQVARDASSISAQMCNSFATSVSAILRSWTSCSQPPLELSSPRCSTRWACRPTSNLARRSILRFATR